MELITFSELIDKLITINVKLFTLLETTADLAKKETLTKAESELMVKLAGDNVRLAKLRSELKTAIDNKLNDAIKAGGTTVLDEVKNYHNTK